MTEEIWIKIKKYPNYLISNKGNVFSISTNRLKILRSDKNGYLTVSLFKNNKEKNCKVHRLVAEAFIPNPNNLYCINHKDENKANNNVDNLEWCTISYNNTYKNKHLRCCKLVDMFDLKGSYIKTFNSLTEVCEYFGKSKGNLSSHLNGKQKTFAGHIFKYHIETLPHSELIVN